MCIAYTSLMALLRHRILSVPDREKPYMICRITQHNLS